MMLSKLRESDCHSITINIVPSEDGETHVPEEGRELSAELIFEGPKWDEINKIRSEVGNDVRIWINITDVYEEQHQISYILFDSAESEGFKIENEDNHYFTTNKNRISYYFAPFTKSIYIDDDLLYGSESQYENSVDVMFKIKSIYLMHTYKMQIPFETVKVVISD